MYATHEEMKQEAINRMKALSIYGPAIKQFDKDNIIMVSEPNGGLYWADDAEMEMIKQFEDEHDAVVYIVVRQYFKFGKCDSLLYVSKYKDEWEMDNEDIRDDIPMSYTVNHDWPDGSEFGSIGVRYFAGGLIRTA